MLLSISDRNQITQQELNTLATWHSKTEKLVIRLGADGKGKLETIPAKDFNRLQLFLLRFNMGKLANVKSDLCDVTDYLSRFDWSVGADAESEYHLEYTKVVKLAVEALNGAKLLGCVEKEFSAPKAESTPRQRGSQFQ